MRQVFRLMDMPDRVIAFDELPKEFLEGLEMCDCSKLPRHWREFIGFRDKLVRIPPDRDPFTGQMRTYTPVIQNGPYAYLVDRELNHDKERWSEIESYVRRNAPKDFRLLDKLSDMAKPFAKDVHSELDLEPENVVVIPLSKAGEALEPQAATVSVAPVAPAAPAPAAATVSVAPAVEAPAAAPQPAASPTFCDVCKKEFSSKQAVRMHKMKRHAEVKTAA